MKLSIKNLRITRERQDYGPYTAAFPQLERVAVLGPGEAGTSVLARTLSGVIPSFAQASIAGQILLDGIDQLSIPFAERRRNFGYVFADPEAMMCTLQVKSELAFELENIGLPPAEIEQQILTAARAIGIAHLFDRRIDTLSGGQMQRLALAIMLVTGAHIILYDDPLKNVDIAGRSEFAQILRDARARGLASLVFAPQLHEDWYTFDTYCIQNRDGIAVFDNCHRWLEYLASAHSEAPSVIVPAELEVICRLKGCAPRIFDAIQISDDAGVAWPDVSQFKSALSGARRPQKSSGAKISIRDLTYRYPTSGSGIEGISIDIYGPGITAVMGANGAGKSTLAKILTGLLSPDQGAIDFGDTPVRGANVRDLASRIAYVFQDPRHQFVTDSVADEIRFGLPRSRSGGADARIGEIASFVGLTKVLNVHPYRLTPNEQRLLSLGAALATDRSILIVDEPTYGVDFAGFQMIKRILKILERRGMTILLISHDLDFLADVATWGLVLESGRVKFNGLLAAVTVNDTGGLWPTTSEFLRRVGFGNPGDWFLPPSAILSALDQL